MPVIRDQALAKQTVYRWYRIKPPFWLPGRWERFYNIDHILPLESKQVERWTYEGVVQPRPYWIYGKFDPGTEAAKSEMEAPDPDVLKHPEGLCTRPRQLDTERGIVQFSDPIYDYDYDDDDGERYIIPAKLYLRTAVNLRDPETLGWIREEWEAVPPVKSSALKSTRYIKHEDVVVEWYFSRGLLGGAQSNLAEMTKQADKHLAAAMLEYQPKDSASMTYPGLHEIEPDGAILQVSWIVAPNGRATTRVSRNREESHIAPGQEEMRVFERLFREFRDKQKPARQLSDDFHKRKAPL